jgi:hypothetical protein
MTVTHPSLEEEKHIERKNQNEAHRALRWMMTMDGKSTAQFKVLKTKAKLFAGGTIKIRMQSYDATAAYKSY